MGVAADGGSMSRQDEDRYVSAKDGSWIVWVGTDGRASLYDTRGDAVTCVGTVKRKAVTT